jgi:hypothetical protein
MTTVFASHPLVAALRGIGLPHGEYVVFGSAPLLAAGLRERIADPPPKSSSAPWSRPSPANPCPGPATRPDPDAPVLAHHDPPSTPT